ncbi:type VI secretion system baseplate subunit TssK [Massilia sp. P8910]|uniref:type VI secretion system baseplate subunit TssK n=1 Tax=Massilia antarctica TaxID=2765360 RepID=UPI001E61BC09|nr:type VI secretion system baseplate subunit TssK [Massilia antarctica]MCE3603131.1 type VI secretion system baseplate subunit TssK [Massilia antarctica]
MAEAQLYDRIQWHEGMLLSPQQFQQESARVDALVGWQSLAGQPAAWGVRRLVLDEARLTTGTLRILALEAILPNGMAVHFDAARAQDQELELDLAPYAQRMELGDLAVYLAVGAARALNLPGQPAMFRGLDSGSVDDEVSQALACEVPRMTANLQLIAGKAPGASYVALHLANLRKENEIVRRGAFWPAQLEVPGDSSLCRRAGELAAHMRSKAVFLARQNVAPSSRLEDRLALLEQQNRLTGLVLHLPLLEAVLRAPVLQPQPLYLALCAQLGPLAALRPGAVPMAPPPYRHADSYAAFDAVLLALQDLVDEVSQDWKTCTFDFDGQAFTLPMRAEWLGKRLVVGMRGNGERELGQWMGGAVIGSRTIWTSLCERRMLGAARGRIDAAPELGLRASAGYALFEVDTSDQFIVADQALQISNINEHLAANRPQELVLFIKGAP